jgi:amino acid transporter
MSTELATEYEASDKHLKRTIGLFSLIGLAVSIQIGSGWLLATLSAVARSGPAAVVSWIIGAVFFAVIGISWMELGTMLPRSGGGVRYPRMTHGGFLSWMNGWGYLIAVVALPVIETQAVLTYVGGHWKHLGLVTQTGDGPVMLSWPKGIVVGWFVLLIFFALNIFGAKLLTESNKIVTIWKIVVPTITVILMLSAFNASNFSEHGGFAPMGWGAVFGAVSGGGIVFAYAGIRQIVDFGGEVINPKRNIPLAMLIGGLLIPLAMYTLLQIGFIGAIDWNAAQVDEGNWAGLLTSHWASEPLLAAVTAAGFSWFALVLLSDAVLSPAACGWVWVGLGGRTLYSMSVNNELPQSMQKVNRFGVPWVALTGSTAVGFLMFLPVPSWYTFVGMVSTALVLNYLIAGPCMAVFAKVAPELPRPIKVPGSSFWGGAGYVCSLLLVYFAGWMTMVNVMTIVVIGLPIYASYASVRAGYSPRTASGALSLVFTVVWVFIGVKSGWLFASSYKVEHWGVGLYMPLFIGLTAAFIAILWAISTPEGKAQIRAGLWVIVALLGATFLTYFGDAGPQPVVRYGLDVLAVIALGVLTYAWAVRVGYRTWEMDQVVQNTLAEAELQTDGAKLAR